MALKVDFPNSASYNDTVRVSASFTDSTGTAQDPSVVSFAYQPQGTGTTTTLTYPDPALIKDSTGHYHVDLLVTTAGLWSFNFIATGTGADSQQGYFYVQPNPLGGSVSPPTGTVLSLDSVTIAQAASQATLSAELNTAPSSWTIGANVTNQGGGSYAFSAPAGTISTPISVTSGQRYLISWTIGANPSDTCGHLTVSLGSVSAPQYLWSCSDAGVYPRTADITAGATGSVNLTFTPDTDFHGHISAISIKRITASITATWLQTDGGGTSMEARSNSTLLMSAMGLNALKYNVSTVAGDFGTTGTNNTSFGNAALASNSSGYKNTALGATALQSNSVGFYNTAGGYGALQANTVGFRNTAFGVLALSVNTVGYLNTAVGDETLAANTTGTNNTAVGVSAVQDCTTGSFNTGVGVAALNLVTTGSDNTGCGVSALQDLVTGDLNTAVGTGALQSATSGSENTAVGGNSLFFQLAQSNNTGLGYNAGADPLDINNTNKQIIADTQMTLLGYGATKNTASTITNSTPIGYRAWVTKSNQFMFGNSSVTEWNLGASQFTLSGGGNYVLSTDTSRLTNTGLRLQCQSSNNSVSYYTALPNGSTTESGLRAYNTSDGANVGWVDFNITATSAGIAGSKAGTGTAPTVLKIGAMTFQVAQVLTFSTLPTCNGAATGMLTPISDSNTATFGATISGSGANKGIAYCDGTNWTYR